MVDVNLDLLRSFHVALDFPPVVHFLWVIFDGCWKKTNLMSSLAHMVILYKSFEEGEKETAAWRKGAIEKQKDR